MSFEILYTFIVRETNKKPSYCMKRTKVIDLLKSTEFGKEVTVMGWVRTKRDSKSVWFITVNDGSIIHNKQAVVDVANFDAELLKSLSTGACVSITGTLVQSQGKGQEEQDRREGSAAQGAQGKPRPGESTGQGRQPLQGQMSEANALRLLNALMESAKELQDLRRPPVRPQDHEVQKDW